VVRPTDADRGQGSAIDGGGDHCCGTVVGQRSTLKV